jgi:hypothetical protein
LLAVAGLVFALALSNSVHAATIANNAAWPTLPATETGDVHGDATTYSQRYLKLDRQLRQTFQVGSTFDIGKIYLSSRNYTGEDFTIKIFEVIDVEAANWSAGAQIGSTITIPMGTAFAGPSNLEITLAAGEQFTLAQRNSGVQGYGMELQTVGTEQALDWAHAFDNAPTVEFPTTTYTDYSNPGRYYQESGVGQALNYDMGLAFTPEPATMSLLAIGGIALIRRRRRA